MFFKYRSAPGNMYFFKSCIFFRSTLAFLRQYSGFLHLSPVLGNRSHQLATWCERPGRPPSPPSILFLSFPTPQGSSCPTRPETPRPGADPADPQCLNLQLALESPLNPPNTCQPPGQGLQLLSTSAHFPNNASAHSSAPASSQALNPGRTCTLQY